MRNIIVIVISIIPLLPGLVESGENPLYLVYGQPTWDIGSNQPFPVEIYLFDTADQVLLRVWRNPDSSNYIWSIRLFYSEHLIEVTSGRYSIEGITYLPMRLPLKPSEFKWLREQNIISHHLYITKDNRRVLEMRLGDESNRDKIYSEYWDVEKEIVMSFSKDTEKEIRLAGITASRTPNSDIIPCHLDNENCFICKATDYYFEENRLPDILERLEALYGWNIIANEPGYRAFLSNPYSKDILVRNLLLYDKNNDKWHSIFIPGTETSLRIVNGRLVGTLAYANSKTDYRIRSGYPSIFTDSAIIISPTEGSYDIFQLGKDNEILLIDNMDIYYRLGEELYKAQIEGNNLIDPTLLIRDPKIKHVHWAFRTIVNRIK